MNLFANPVFVGVLMLVVGCFLGYCEARRRAGWGWPDSFDTEPEAEPVIDPWALQRDLMERSQQRLPTTPRLHNGVVLYAALNLEEMSEMCESMSNALAHYPCITTPGVPTLAERFLTIGRSMRNRSLEIRQLLKDTEIGNHQLCPKDAKALFDDTTDIAVTNSGFALSCGFPGPQGYAEVQNSNLSKANPETGYIDKTVDGKWIKGPNYFEPDLLRVLAHYAPVWGMRHGVTWSPVDPVRPEA